MADHLQRDQSHHHQEKVLLGTGNSRREVASREAPACLMKLKVLPALIVEPGG
jgi:hypothetical protein